MLHSTHLNQLFKLNKNFIMKMEIEVTEKTTKMVEIELPTPKYVKFMDKMFYKYHEEEGEIITTKFDFDITLSNPFSLSVTKNLDIKTFMASEEGYSVITGSEFYGTLKGVLAKYSIAHITPEFDAPTLFLQEDNSIINNHLKLQP